MVTKTRTKSISRLDVNRKVRAILQRASANLSEIQVSYAGRNVRLYGNLVKESGSQYSAEQVDSMVNEMKAIPGVSGVIGELDNWTIGGGAISRKGTEGESQEDGKKEGGKKSGSSQSGGSDDDEGLKFDFD